MADGALIQLAAQQMGSRLASQYSDGMACWMNRYCIDGMQDLTMPTYPAQLGQVMRIENPATPCCGALRQCSRQMGCSGSLDRLSPGEMQLVRQLSLEQKRKTSCCGQKTALRRA